MIVFDGVASSEQYLDPISGLPTFLPRYDKLFSSGRFCFQHHVQVGTSNCAAHVRNIAIALAVTPWVGFVDDDDSLEPGYVESILQESQNNPSIDIIVFRMTNGKFLYPPADATNLFVNTVGISFAARRYLWSELNFEFHPSHVEDFMFLHHARQRNRTILLSSEIKYYVHNRRPTLDMVESDRTRINVLNSSDPLIQESVQRNIGLFRLANNPNRDISCPRQSMKPPTFIFTEHNNLFFGANVRGLQAAIDRATARGCLDRWTRGPMKIHVMFEPASHPPGSKFIQVQMEQYNSSHMNDHYINKLNHALQVWEFAPSYMSATVAEPYSTPGYYIPSMVSLPHDTPVYNCASDFDLFARDNRAPNTVMTFEIYRFGSYRQCVVRKDGQVISGSIRTSSSCAMYKDTDLGATCSDEYSRAAINSDDNECHRAYYGDLGVLLFGAMEGSHMRQRERICDDLQFAISLANETHISGSLPGSSQVLCITQAFGPILEHFVCKAKLIVNEHYYATSAIEAHRLNPLIQARKKILTTPSYDASLEAVYAPYVEVLPRDKLIARAQWLLNSGALLSLNGLLAEKFAIESKNVDPLCHALHMLTFDARGKK